MFRKLLCWLGGHSFREDSSVNFEFESGAVMVQAASHCAVCRRPDFLLGWYGLE